MQQVTWIKSTTQNWLPLDGFSLDGVKTDGVYIIWHGGNPSRVVYVGQGDVSKRIASHRTDARFKPYALYGLFVTWASLPASHKDGVERHLADTWSPLIGDAHPLAHPIAVNSPW